MYLALLSVTPFTTWPVWTIILVGTFWACEQYDTTDGLKAGLDDAQLKHSRAALRFYAKQGIRPDDQAEDKEK
ncbi:MAG: hypothetical protein A3J66_04440 [Candidatus Magasanikbacteria bacterium RIFCSPHIGHO2_02_FULL_47_14]|uniref:Uncharacterized protein n=1 Tax=Candidatus Magasanikbacteria bacterium RIFCSPHIGHO2_02_FULL_47_14 TaxID=1798680 RepID=A0A1F6M4D5_9BACT|nr:MAG: hypothetical protein A3J66_04440 [Candidatus Magasanikbacteria bacterium RIFCSPHIGHO2_02_FULL_47_14]